MSVNPYIECGKIINTHGCHGGVKLESWCNTPEDFVRLSRVFVKENQNYRELKVVKASVMKQFVVAVLDTVNSMDEALALKGRTVYALREDFHLGDGEYFIADLSGLSVIDAKNGKKYGTLKEVINRGASDIYVISTPNGEQMMPAVDEFVDHVDIREGIFVTPIEGMLD